LGNSINDSRESKGPRGREILEDPRTISGAAFSETKLQKFGTVGVKPRAVEAPDRKADRAFDCHAQKPSATLLAAFMSDEGLAQVERPA